MKLLVKFGSWFFFLALMFFSTRVALAQHACSCTPTCSRSCTQPSCAGTCNNNCSLGLVSNLQYVGSTNLIVNLSWDSATNATSYTVNVIDVETGSSISGYPKTGITTTTDSFTGVAGKSYNWTVQPVNWCYNGTAISGSLIGLPSLISVTLASGQVQSCLDTVCNGSDLVVGLDNDHNQSIPVSLVVSDLNSPTGSRLSDLETVYFILDNDTTLNNGTYDARFIYTDNEDGTQSFVLDPTSPLQSLTIANFNPSFAGNNLTINFDLIVSGLVANESFLTNIYLNAKDFSDIWIGRTLKIGTGTFTSPPADAYSGNALAAIDVWNGQDVAVSNVGYYPVGDYTDVCTQVGLPSSVSLDLDVSYSPDNSGGWLEELLSWDSSTQYQPYYHYNSDSYQASYSPIAGSNYFLLGMSSQQYGGNCQAVAVDGSVTNRFLNGGIRAEDSGVGDNSLETAFALMQVSSSWSQIVDGNFFSNSSLSLGIEPLTCPTCSLMAADNSTNNGIVLANGEITADENALYGSPQNWYGKIQAGHEPLKSQAIGKTYQEIKDLYESGTYTELSGAQTVGSGSLTTVTENTSYLIDGDLVVSSSTLLRAGEGDYLLFVVNGNLTITSGVKDSLAGGGSAIQAMFVVLGDITIEDDVTDNSDDLTIEGALVSQGSINFERSLYTNNNYRPPVTIVFRPDMLGAMAEDNVGIISLQKSLVSQY